MDFDLQKLLDPISIWAAVGVLVFVGMALYTDLKSRTIPNEITVTSFVLALVLHSFFGGWQGFLFSISGFAVGFGMLFLLWVIGGGGGGDVKLMGAAGAWVGAFPILIIFIGSAVFAIFCTMFMMFRNPSSEANPGESGKNSVDDSGLPLRSKSKLKQSIPYAVPVAMATVCVVLLLLIPHTQ